MTSSRKPSRPSSRAVVLAILLGAGFLLACAPVLAQQTAPAAPVPPIPFAQPAIQIPIPGLDYAAAVKRDTSITIPWIGQYVAGVYNFLLSIVGALAAVMMMIGGFQYLTAGGDKNKVDAGRKRIVNALSGMVLALGSYVVLYVINPDLVRFKALEIDFVAPQIYEPTAVPPEMGVAAPPTKTGGGASHASSGKVAHFCDSDGGVEKCKTVCAAWSCGTKNDVHNCDWSLMPQTAEGVIIDSSPDLIPARKWPKMQNIKVPGDVLATKDVVDGLGRADAYLSNPANPYGGKGYKVIVHNCWRDYRADTSRECGYVMQGIDPNSKGLAWPGGSPHSAGVACDMDLQDPNGKGLINFGINSQGCDQYHAGVTALATIMTDPQVGAKRLAFETWHFEWGGGGPPCRCVSVDDCEKRWKVRLNHFCKVGPFTDPGPDICGK